jgi:hypothetical protein
MHSQQSSSVRTRMSSKRSLIQLTFPNTKNDTLVFDLTKTSTLVAAVRAMPRIFPIGDVPVSQDEVLCDVENSYIIRGPLGPKKVYQNRLQSQASIPSRALDMYPGSQQLSCRWPLSGRSLFRVSISYLYIVPRNRFILHISVPIRTSEAIQVRTRSCWGLLVEI